GEDEHEQQRLQDRAGQEFLEVLAQHDQVAQEEGPEGGDAGGAGAPRGQHRGGRRSRPGGRFRAGGVGGGHSRRSFPVILMNTVSSVGSVMPRSWTTTPAASASATTAGRTPRAPLTPRTTPSRATSASVAPGIRSRSRAAKAALSGGVPSA